MAETKTILITGGSRGIGRALACGAAAAGLDVAINYRSDRAGAEALADELAQGGICTLAVQADVAVAADAARLIETVAAQFGRIDCVVNNAGIGTRIALDDLDEAVFTHTLQANLVSAFLVSQAALPWLRVRGGRLVFLSSIAARTGGLLSAAYASSKAGVEGLMHYYATYLRGEGITANAISPASIETDMMPASGAGDPAALPMGRLGRAEEVWPALRMILDTDYLTGQTIHVDAGRYMT